MDSALALFNGISTFVDMPLNKETETELFWYLTNAL